VYIFSPFSRFSFRRRHYEIYIYTTENCRTLGGDDGGGGGGGGVLMASASGTAATAVTVATATTTTTTAVFCKRPRYLRVDKGRRQNDLPERTGCLRLDI